MGDYESIVGGATVKSGSQVEDEPIVGSWFWTEKKKPVVHSDHRLSRSLLAVPCLELGEKTSMWKLRLMPLPNQCQQMTKKRSSPVFAGLMKKPAQRLKKRPHFGGLGFGSVISPCGSWAWGQLIGSRPKSEEKEVIVPWFGAGEEISTVAEFRGEEAGQELRQYFWPGLGWKSGQHGFRAEVNCDTMPGTEEEEPIIGSWFWPGVEACGRAKVNNKSSLEDKEKYYIALVWDH